MGKAIGKGKKLDRLKSVIRPHIFLSAKLAEIGGPEKLWHHFNMSSKKTGFANLQYPGMRVDPTEGQSKFSADYRARFQAEILSRGEAAQARIYDASVAVVGMNPLGTAMAQKLAELGVGRIGLVLDVVQGARSAVNEVRQALEKDFPWLHVEAFRVLAIDRSLEDILRGFNVAFRCDLASDPQNRSSDRLAGLLKETADRLLVESSGVDPVVIIPG